MTRFPVQNLSEKLIAEVLDNCAVPDLLHFSLCSNKAQKIVMHFAAGFPSLETYIHTHYVSFAGVRWKFLHPRDKENAYLRNHHYEWIQGRQYLLCESESGEQYCLTATPQLCTLHFASYLMCLFRCNLDDLAVELDDLTMDCLLDIQSWQFSQKPRQFSVYGGAVSHKEMHNFLDNYSSRSSWLCCQPPKDFVYEKPISAYYISLSSSYWFTRQNLLSADCAQISLDTSTLTGADINAFIRQWLISDNQKLQYLEVTGRSKRNDHADSIQGLMGYEQLDMEQVLEGLETMPGTRKRADATSHRDIRDVPYENGVDLRRKDGKLATILEYRRFQSVTLFFLFVVWLDPNPFAP